MTLIVDQFEIFVAEIEQVPPFRIQAHLRQGKRFAAELGIHLIEMVQVDMHIPEGVPRKTSALRWYIWQLSLPLAT